MQIKMHEMINWSKLISFVVFYINTTFLSIFSGDKLAYLYEELQTNEASQHLIPHFEEVMSALITDVKKIDESKRKMEEKIKK